MGEVNEHFFNNRRMQNRWGKKGITIQHKSPTSDSNDCEVVTMQILATSEMDGAVIQCAAIATRENVDSSYSRFAVLQVQSLQETMENTASNIAPSPPT